ncbi:hypothetical protein KYK29_05070 [Shinella daejeonensis]|uniref:hypothetical protein n=1 Tax=Shinella daejeonensis TaxID=659017 RepID=UPI0020C78D0A|nr:hypothetical protein [Shinella daejeonensis]MCP8894292.1 hypothetical protein [Shinella daejeonensis]
MKFTKPFRGARRGEAFPTDFKIGDDCPPELLAAARAIGAIEDGPTVAEYVAAGYLAKNYPPQGYASRSTPEENAQAVAAQEAEAKAKLEQKAKDALGNKAEGAPKNKAAE